LCLTYNYTSYIEYTNVSVYNTNWCVIAWHICAFYICQNTLGWQTLKIYIIQWSCSNILVFILVLMFKIVTIMMDRDKIKNSKIPLIWKLILHRSRYNGSWEKHYQTQKFCYRSMCVCVCVFFFFFSLTSPTYSLEV
jgi:hypothetical protein